MKPTPYCQPEKALPSLQYEHFHPSHWLLHLLISLGSCEPFFQYLYDESLYGSHRLAFVVKVAVSPHSHVDSNRISIASKFSLRFTTPADPPSSTIQKTLHCV